VGSIADCVRWHNSISQQANDTEDMANHSRQNWHTVTTTLLCHHSLVQSNIVPYTTLPLRRQGMQPTGEAITGSTAPTSSSLVSLGGHLSCRGGL